jgi:hypothetical protein
MISHNKDEYASVVTEAFLNLKDILFWFSLHFIDPHNTLRQITSFRAF